MGVNFERNVERLKLTPTILAITAHGCRYVWILLRRIAFIFHIHIHFSFLFIKCLLFTHKSCMFWSVLLTVDGIQNIIFDDQCKTKKDENMTRFDCCRPPILIPYQNTYQHLTFNTNILPRYLRKSNYAGD